MKLWRRRKPSETAGYVSRVDPIIEMHESGEINAKTASAMLLGLGDLRSGMYDSSGRCRHLGPYPGCRGGCNRFKNLV